MTTLTTLDATCTPDEAIAVVERDGGVIIRDFFDAVTLDELRSDIDIAMAATPWGQDDFSGHRTKRLPGNASFAFPGRSGESILLDLERRGVVCSSGSACAAGSDEPSHVLTAMGYPAEIAQTAVRFTFGRDVSEEQLAEAASILKVVLGSQ